MPSLNPSAHNPLNNRLTPAKCNHSCSPRQAIPQTQAKSSPQIQRPNDSQTPTLGFPQPPTSKPRSKLRRKLRSQKHEQIKTPHQNRTPHSPPPTRRKASPYPSWRPFPKPCPSQHLFPSPDLLRGSSGRGCRSCTRPRRSFD